MTAEQTLEEPQIDIIEEMSTSYTKYAMSVIVSRALPDVRDGLKPVQRRILYAMYKMGLRPQTAHRKSARIVGEVLGKYHPHGDSSVYEAMVRMAQPFSMRMPLVNGQGNFGSIDDDPAAAMRYTEAKMARVAEAMMTDIDDETVPFIDNFDGSEQEPTILPNQLPNLLINGSKGIAVGMATNIPPHNIGEVCDAIVMTIENPAVTVTDLMTAIKGPDLPTGAIIHDQEGIREMYETGNGRFTMEAQVSIEEGQRQRRHIIVTEIPYHVSKSKLVARIAALVREKHISGITNIRDESDRKGIRVVIDLAREAQPQVVLNNLMRQTDLQCSFSANMLALVDGQPKQLPLNEIIHHFIEHRTEIITNRTKHQLEQHQRRIHIVDGLLTALDNIDEVINIIRTSEANEAAATKLAETFNLSPEQSQAILEMQLRRIASLEIQKLKDEHQTLTTTIAELENLLARPDLILAETKRETIEIKTRFNEPRRTVIKTDPAEEIQIEDLIVQEDVVVTLSKQGYLKRMPLSTYKSHRRGTKGVQSGSRDDDVITQLEVMNTHDQILFFTSKGRVHTLDVFKTTNDTSRNSQGIFLVNLINTQSDEYVKIMMNMSKSNQKPFYVLATRNGRIALVIGSEIASMKKSQRHVMKIEDDDEIISVKTAQPGDRVCIMNTDGRILVNQIDDIRPNKRGTSGVIGMDTTDGSQVVAMDIISDNQEHLIMATKNGYAKVTPVSKFRIQNKRGKGSIAFKTDKNSGELVDAQVITKEAMDNPEQHEVFVASNKGQVVRINLSDIRIIDARYSKGVIIWRERKQDDAVASISCFKAPFNESDDEDETATNQDQTESGEGKESRQEKSKPTQMTFA